MRRVLIVVTAGVGVLLGGCAVSRLDKLHAKADKVEASLKAERGRVIALAADPTRETRLGHLTQLHTTLSAANIGLGIVPHAVPADKRDIAYDVFDEVYDTIDWNIPLGPNEPKRALPSQFADGVLKLN